MAQRVDIQQLEPALRFAGQAGQGRNGQRGQKRRRLAGWHHHDAPGAACRAAC